MNKYFTIILLIAIGSLQVLAEPITIQTASQVGQSFLTRPVDGTGKLKTKIMQSNLALVYSADAQQIDTDTPLSDKAAQKFIPFYVFSNDFQGYVIVAGDDRVTPILGYADEGVFNADNIPPSMQKWLEGYKAEIRYVIENDIAASPEIQSEWLALRSGLKMKSQTLAASVAPLIATRWDQSPYYNEMCPYDISGERTVTGCVATAMAQVLKFWNYPEIGSGFHSYNHIAYGTLSANFGSTAYGWTSMPNQLTASSSTAQKNAVATLMYHCGVSVEMNYNIASEGGSGAMTICSGYSDCTVSAEDALKTYFGYKTSLQGVHKSDYTATGWTDLLKTELDAGRPIIYAGRGDEGGHCFVCDGYDNNSFFHFNWGWSGQNDGYFALSALNPGSGGAGGGSYNFTDAQRAIIGIEPANAGPSNEAVNLSLFSEISMSSEQIWFKSAFDLDVDIVNLGNTRYTGQLGVALFDNEGNFVDFMEVKTAVSLNANSYFNVPFSSAGSAALVPGTYYAAIFYKTATQDWTIISDGSYTNLKQFEIYYSSDIEVNSSFTITTNGGVLIQGQSATVNVDVVNKGSNTFIGKYRLNLANLDGSWAQNIQILNETGLPSNYHYTGGNDFTGTITVAPGTYLMEVGYQSQGSTSWYYAGSTNFSNPVYVIVKSPEIQSDIYENNDTQPQAYSLNASFSGSNASQNSNGSNLHIGTDIDYYKVVLPSGYNYAVTPRVHDSYNSGNGQTYTVDALFSYSINGITYSETYDDLLDNPVSVNNGGTFYIKVAPYFSGNTGTYLLDLNITRSVLSGIENEESDAQILMYPNPADVFVTIDLQQFTGKVNQIDLWDVNGNQLYSEKVAQNKHTVMLPLNGISSGVYMIRIYTDKEIITKKLVVEK